MSRDCCCSGSEVKLPGISPRITPATFLRPDQNAFEAGRLGITHLYLLYRHEATKKRNSTANREQYLPADPAAQPAAGTSRQSCLPRCHKAISQAHGINLHAAHMRICTKIDQQCITQSMRKT